MIAGLIFTSSYIIYFKYINPAANDSTNWFLGISPEGIGFLGMMLNFLVAYSVSFATPKVPENIIKLINDIRKPE